MPKKHRSSRIAAFAKWYARIFDPQVWTWVELEKSAFAEQDRILPSKLIREIVSNDNTELRYQIKIPKRLAKFASHSIIIWLAPVAFRAKLKILIRPLQILILVILAFLLIIPASSLDFFGFFGKDFDSQLASILKFLSSLLAEVLNLIEAQNSLIWVLIAMLFFAIFPAMIRLLRRILVRWQPFCFTTQTRFYMKQSGLLADPQSYEQIACAEVVYPTSFDRYRNLGKVIFQTSAENGRAMPQKITTPLVRNPSKLATSILEVTIRNKR